MEFPFGHHHKHNQRREEGEEEERRRYPPSGYRPQDFPLEGAYTENPVYPPPPPPGFHPHHHHPRPEGFREGEQGGYGETRYERPPPPPTSYGSYSEYPPEPQSYPPRPSEPVYSSVQHVSHEERTRFEPDRFGYGREEAHHHRNPLSFHHHQKGSEGSEVVNKPTVRVYSMAGINHSLTILDGKVVLAQSDPNDKFQHWIKDEKYSTRVKDQEGFPSFALVNKATGQAIKHSIGATHPVQLCPYNPDVLDESVLWTESKDMGDGFRAVRMVNNTRLNFDAFHGDHGKVRDGTIVVLWDWNRGDNQKWKIVPYCKFPRFQSQ